MLITDSFPYDIDRVNTLSNGFFHASADCESRSSIQNSRTY